MAALKTLFNKRLDGEKIPSRCDNASMVLIYKRGNPADIGKYRPISLLSHIYVYEDHYKNWIVGHQQAKNYRTDIQFCERHTQFR